MTILCGYYNSLNGDRKYNAEKMSMYFSGLFTKGVLQNYKNKFVVTANGGMTVKIPTGKAYFSDGKYIENTADIILTLEPSDVVLNRIDRIVLRNDKNENARNASIVIKKGAYASIPQPPILVNNDYIEELCLCEISINKLVESITQANIKNTIMDNTKCGYVTGLINQIDTTEVLLQYEAMYNEFYERSITEFEEWFQNLRDEISTSTLLREYTETVTTNIQNQTDIPITEGNYNFDLDILEVYINGIRLIQNKDYINHETYITLTKPLDINNDVELVIFKSIDGYNAENIISQVETLNNQMARLQNYIYYATGIDDNIKLSKIAQDFYLNKGKFSGYSENAELEIKVVGELGISNIVAGLGSAEDPLALFVLGKYNNTNTSEDSTSSTRKIIFDFTLTNRITTESQAGRSTVLFAGNENNIVGLQAIMGGEGTSLYWLNGKDNYIRDSKLYMNANNIAIGSNQGGTFERCQLSCTSISGKANVLVSNGIGILKVIDCYIVCYNGTNISDESICILAEGNRSDSVVIVERCNMPLLTKDGYKQSQTIKISNGYASIVSNILGKEPALYDTVKCTNIGTMIVNKY